MLFCISRIHYRKKFERTLSSLIKQSLFRPNINLLPIYSPDVIDKLFQRVKFRDIVISVRKCLRNLKMNSKDQDDPKKEAPERKIYDEVEKFLEQQRERARNNPKGNNPNSIPPNRNYFGSLGMFFLVLSLILMALSSSGLKTGISTRKSITLEDFIFNHLNETRTISFISDSSALATTATSNVFFTFPSKEYLIQRLEEASTEKDKNISNIKFLDLIPKAHEKPFSIFELFFNLFITGLLVSTLIMVFKRKKGDGLNFMDMIKNSPFSSSHVKRATISTVKFSDVKGCDEAKMEIKEFVDFLKNPNRFKSLGARIPRGAILHGPPGTGKTMLAKAVAGEANVPCFTVSGSEFVEMFVGVGAKRVRELFENAKKEAPAIIFIDEIDAIGTSRGLSNRRSHSEGDQTLNQLLVELDGFDTDSNVVVLCGTNRFEILDEALTRPGRLDRKIFLSPPDLKGRKELFSHYLAKVKVNSESIDEYSSKLSGLTPGSTGADISSIVNEAAILAARENQESISLEHLEISIDRLVLGNRLSRNLTPSEKRSVAIHESGHTVVAWFLKNTYPILKVTIIPRGMALGVNQFLPTEETLTSKEDITHMMAAILGGRAAEELVLKTISTGAANDLQKITKMAYEWVGVYGMDGDIGNLSYPSLSQKFSQHPAFAPPAAEYGNDIGNKIDVRVKKIVDESYVLAKKILSDNADKLKKLYEQLESRETLSNSEIETILGPRPEGSRTVVSVLKQTGAGVSPQPNPSVTTAAS